MMAAVPATYTVVAVAVAVLLLALFAWLAR